MGAVAVQNICLSSSLFSSSFFSSLSPPLLLLLLGQCLLPREGPGSNPAAAKLPRPQAGPSLPARTRPPPARLWASFGSAPGCKGPRAGAFLYTDRSSQAGAGRGLLVGELCGSISVADRHLSRVSLRLGGFPLAMGWKFPTQRWVFRREVMTWHLGVCRLHSDC